MSDVFFQEKINIPTLEEIKKQRYTRVKNESSSSIVTAIHAAICSGVFYVDIPYVIQNNEDEKIMIEVFEEFKNKGYKFDIIDTMDQDCDSPFGKLKRKIIFNRFYIGDNRCSNKD